MRLKDRVAIVVGAGQTPGETMGNGRATAIAFAREGARVLLVDRDIDRAKETEEMIRNEGAEAASFAADVSRDCATFIAECMRRYGRIDILHNNVGIGRGDGNAIDLDLETWHKIMDVNLTSVLLACKHALPIMREQRTGSIVNVSSIAAVCTTPLVAYKVSKAGVNALTQQLALANAEYGIRVNAIMPGFIETPMAIEGLSEALGVPKGDLIAQRNARVPLRHQMGTAWDVASAAVFLASDDARFITGVLLPVDGGQSARIG